MINSMDIVDLTRQIMSAHGIDALYAQPLENIAEKDQLCGLLSKAAETDAETLADTLVESLEMLTEADVLVEEIIEYVGNHSEFKNFTVLAEDEDLSEHTPIYLLEKHGAF